MTATKGDRANTAKAAPVKNQNSSENDSHHDCPSDSASPATRARLTRWYTAHEAMIQPKSPAVRSRFGDAGVGATPADSMTSQAAVTLIEYCPTLNSTFHTGLRATISLRSTAAACSTSAGYSPHTNSVANTNANEMDTGFPGRRVITIGRSSLSSTTTVIIAIGKPIATHSAGLSCQTE